MNCSPYRSTVGRCHSGGPYGHPRRSAARFSSVSARFTHRTQSAGGSGRIGTPANVVAPSKRMLSSMTPTIVAKDGRVVLVTGSPGGRTINTVLCVVLNVLEFEMSPREAVDAGRFRHQWLPDRVQLERRIAGLQPQLAEQLRALGHTVETRASLDDAHTIYVDPAGEQIGVANKRRSGAAAGR